MIRLMREVRFFAAGAGNALDRGTSNTWAGTSLDCSPPFWTVRLVVEGPPDPRTGYVCDIKVLDDLIRTNLAPALSTSRTEPSFDRTAQDLHSAFSKMVGAAPPKLSLRSIQLYYSPFTSLMMLERGTMLLTHNFEFSASHRLWCADLSDEENLRLFGKCSSPYGHGHNYVLEVAINVDAGSTQSRIADLDRIVRLAVIEHFDHKNLNVQCQEFKDVNPTVENIAQVAFNRLEPTLRPLQLSNVRVWETAKTYAECSRASDPRR